MHRPTQKEIQTEAEQEYSMPSYKTTFYDYDELGIQFGYVTLFIVVFPLVPLLALATNIVEAKFVEIPTIPPSINFARLKLVALKSSIRTLFISLSS